MKRTFLIILLVFLLLKPLDAGCVEVGAYYYPGWYENSPRWRDIRTKWKEREPVSGWQRMDTELYMNQEIEWASLHRLNFFAFDWYWNISEQKVGKSYAIDNFMKVNNRRMKFAVMWANHYRQPQSANLEDYLPLINYWKTKYFDNESYLHTWDRRPILYIFTVQTLLRDLETSGTKRFLQKIKDETGAFLVAVNDGEYIERPAFFKELGYDAIAGWNYLYWVKKWRKRKILTYETYKQVVERVYNQIYNTKIQHFPIFPSVMPGWDDRPWREKTPKCVVIGENPEAFEELLLLANTVLNLRNVLPKIIMIESWNEFGEGSFIIPTKKWGFKYLETIRNISGHNR